MHARIVLLIFILLVCLDWIYVLWIKTLTDIPLNAWSVLIPLTSYFYFSFTMIALIGLYNKKNYGLDLAYGVILFGATSDVISYTLIYKHHVLLEWFIVPILFINLCSALYLACNNRCFRDE